jgi:hypothetical protein
MGEVSLFSSQLTSETIQKLHSDKKKGPYPGVDMVAADWPDTPVLILYLTKNQIFIVLISYWKFGIYYL